MAWKQAMEEEIITLEQNQTWELVSRPIDIKLIFCLDLQNNVSLRWIDQKIQDSTCSSRVLLTIGPVEVIHKIGKASYRIHLLPWIRTNPVVHISNMKRYSFDIKGVKHRGATRPQTNKKNPEAKHVGESLTGETPEANKPKSSFQQSLTNLMRLRNIEISWKHIKET